MRTALFLGLSALLASAAFAEAKEPVDWVNPEVGWISHMLVPVYPTMGRPAWEGSSMYCVKGESEKTLLGSGLRS